MRIKFVSVLTGIFFSFFANAGTPGYVVGWGYQGMLANQSSIQINVPLFQGAMLSNAVAITAARNKTCLVLKEDGIVFFWREGFVGNGPITGLSNIVETAAGSTCSLALKREGTVLAWGDGHFGMTTVPNYITNIVRIGFGDDTCVAVTRGGGI